MIIDYKVLDKMNSKSRVDPNISNLIYLIEEVPKSIKGEDVTKTFLNVNLVLLN